MSIITITQFFSHESANAIRETAWFRSAPAASQARATFRVLGVEHRNFSSVLGARQVRPALIVECRCGALIGTFSLLVNDVGEATLLNEQRSFQCP